MLHDGPDAANGTLQPRHVRFLTVNFMIPPTDECVTLIFRVWSPAAFVQARQTGSDG